MARDSAALAVAKTKLSAYSEANSRVRIATGCGQLQEVIDLFDCYEEEKFTKVKPMTCWMPSLLERVVGCNRAQY